MLRYAAAPSRAISLGISIFAVVGAVACGGGRGAAEEPKRSAVPAQPDPPPESVPLALTEIQRADLDRVLEQGFPQFLQDFEVRAEKDGERFVGFQILKINNAERYRGVGLVPGDVVVSVNSLPIERPEQAFEIFRALQTADRLEVVYLRGGAEMRLSLPIVGEPAPPSEAASEPDAKSQPAAPPAN